MYLRFWWGNRRERDQLEDPGLHGMIIDDPMCPCNEGEQTVEHLIYVCSILEQRRSTMIKHITTRGGIWPPTNNELMDKYLTVFTEFVKSIDFTKEH